MNRNICTVKSTKNIALLVCGISFLVPHNVWAGLDQATKMGLVPHKALYDIRLTGKKSSANVANISGKMFYEWKPSCDAWITNHRYDLTYEYIEAPSVRVTSEFSTYESFDGKQYNFTSQRKTGGMVFEELRGAVEAQDTEYPNAAVFTIPEDLSFELPKGTLFPVAHTLDVLEKIKEGKKFYKATIFDGSDEDGPVDVNSFIGKPYEYQQDKLSSEGVDQNLVKGKVWNLRLAFFPLDAYSPTSDYEMSVVFHENGVISHMDIDYTDFSVSQNLIAIEPLEGACDNEQEDVQEND